MCLSVGEEPDYCSRCAGQKVGEKASCNCPAKRRRERERERRVLPVCGFLLPDRRRRNLRRVHLPDSPTPHHLFGPLLSLLTSTIITIIVSTFQSSIYCEYGRFNRQAPKHCFHLFPAQRCTLIFLNAQCCFLISRLTNANAHRWLSRIRQRHSIDTPPETLLFFGPLRRRRTAIAHPTWNRNRPTRRCSHQARRIDAGSGHDGSRWS